MEGFRVSFPEMLTGADGLSAISEKLDEEASILNSLEAQIKKYSSAAKRYAADAQGNLLNCAKKASSMAGYLREIEKLYQNAEEELMEIHPQAVFLPEALLGVEIDLSSPNVLNELNKLGKSEYAYSAIWPGVLGKMIGYLGKGEYSKIKTPIPGQGKKWGIKNSKKREKEKEDETQFGRRWDGKYVYEKENGKLVKKEKEETENKKTKNEKLKDLAESITIYEATYSFLDEDEKGTVLYEDENGGKVTLNKKDVYIKNRLSAGGFESQIGGVYSMLSIETGEYQVGNDMLGTHASGTVDVMSVSGTAKAGAGWLNEKGEFDPYLYAGLSAEAVLVKATGEGGVDLLGTDVNVKGSIGVGMGFHGDLKMDDGVLTMNFGAYLGIGGDISLEIDLSGIDESLDKVCDFAEDAVGVIGNAVGESVKVVGETISNVGSMISDGAETLKNSISDGWKKLTSWW